jgi:hypothetical protein
MGKKKQPVVQSNWYVRFRNRLSIRSKWLLVLAAVIVAGVAGERLYRGVQQQLANLPEYRLTAEAIHVSPQPPWIRTDVKAEVLESSDALVDISVLGDADKIHHRLVDAFEMHPWVERVERIELLAPAAVDVQLKYRRPAVVVAVKRDNLVELLLVDAHAVRLPDSDLTEAEKLYLPRISDADAQVLVGEPCTDPRIIGAVRLAEALAPVWETYHFIDIAPSPHPQVRHSQRYYIYDIRTNYGTRIHWGAAPEMGPTEEHTVEQKLARLAEYVAQHGPLNSTFTPQAIDIRDRLIVEERTAKKEEAESTTMSR